MLMYFERSQALSLGGFGRPFGFLLTLLVFTTVAAVDPRAFASGVGDYPPAAPEQSSAENRQAEESQHAEENHGPKPGAPSTQPGVCGALATAATTNDLPVDFFTRLIWQESRFRPDAISPKGAQGIAQFMPTTAKLSGLENPFDPLQAIAKSGELLRNLHREFGNLGLAAAAYNAGSQRVRDWLGGRRPIPQETRAYVRIVTGRSVDEWAGAQANPVQIGSAEFIRCNVAGTTSIETKPDGSLPTAAVKPWGVEVVGGPTPAKALARYREWQSKYAILANREPHVVIRGIIGQMAAARVRVSEDTRAAADKLCAALRAAGTWCDVLRN